MSKMMLPSKCMKTTGKFNHLDQKSQVVVVVDEWLSIWPNSTCSQQMTLGFLLAGSLSSCPINNVEEQLKKITVDKMNII